jgi:hypothetical protein
MQNIKVERYEKATPEERASWEKGVGEFADDWQGWIEPEDKSWILFIDKGGKPFFFPKRDKKTGAILE